MDGCAMEQDEPGLYKWVILITAFCIQLSASGIMYCVGVFYVIFKDNLPGSTSSIISLASSLNMGFAFGIGPLAGYLSQRYGHRSVAIVGSIVASTGILLSALVNSAWQLCLTFGVITGIGIGLSYIPSISAVSRYFPKHRAVAIGIAAAGLGTGPIAFPPLIQCFLHLYHWRGAILMVSGLYLHNLLFSCLLKPASDNSYAVSREIQLTSEGAKKDDSIEVRKKIQQSSNGHTDGLLEQKDKSTGPETTVSFTRKHCNLLMSTIYFHMYLLQCVMSAIGSSIVFVHLGAYAITKGVSDDKAALLFLVLGIASTASRVVYGILAQVRCIGPLRIYMIAQAACGISIILYPFANMYMTLSIGATSIGLFFGSFGSLPPLVTVLLVGAENIASGYGYVCLACAIGFTGGGPFAGWLYDHTQHYPLSFFIGGGFVLVSVLLLIPVYYYCIYKVGLPSERDTNTVKE